MWYRDAFDSCPHVCFSKDCAHEFTRIHTNTHWLGILFRFCLRVFSVFNLFASESQGTTNRTQNSIRFDGPFFFLLCIFRWMCVWLQSIDDNGRFHNRACDFIPRNSDWEYEVARQTNCVLCEHRHKLTGLRDLDPCQHNAQRRERERERAQNTEQINKTTMTATAVATQTKKKENTTKLMEH